MCISCSMKARKAGQDVARAVALLDQAEASAAEARKVLERAGPGPWQTLQGYAVGVDAQITGIKVLSHTLSGVASAFGQVADQLAAMPEGHRKEADRG